MDRKCPACGMPAAPGDRYCEPCGSAQDRTSWIDGPAPMVDPRETWTTFVGAESPEEAERLTRDFMRDNEGMEVTEISSVEPGRGPFGVDDDLLEDGYYLAGSWKEIS